MLSRLAHAVVPAFGRLTVTADRDADLAPGSIVVANHTSLADPAVVLAALHRLGVRPVVMAAAGLWRIPLLGGALARGGHIPVHRGDRRAADALDLAEAALKRDRIVLIYAEGGIPTREDAAETPPGPFRTGLSRSRSAPAPRSSHWARRAPAGSRPGTPSSRWRASSPPRCAAPPCTSMWAPR
ncbi:hypothetical protein SUDANB38_05740 [Streptomyces sp. enrichment culture]